MAEDLPPGDADEPAARDEKGNTSPDVAPVIGEPTATRPEIPPAPRKGSKSPYQRRKRLHDPPMFWVTLAGVLAVVLYTVVSAYQAYIAQRTLAVAVNQQRAWLKVEPVPELVGTLSIKKRITFASVDVKITNVGNVPALKIDDQVRLVVMPMKTGGFGSDRGYLTECRDHDPRIGNLALFPGDSIVLHDEIATAFQSDIEKYVGKKGAFIFFLADCVTYRSGIDTRLHHTGELADLVKPGRPPQLGEPGYSIWPVKEIFQADETPADIKGVRLGLVTSRRTD